jgi:hypothetical protein
VFLICQEMLIIATSVKIDMVSSVWIIFRGTGA